jgi:hypothetical protein
MPTPKKKCVVFGLLNPIFISLSKKKMSSMSSSINKDIFRILTTKKNEGWSYDDLMEKLSGYSTEEVKTAMFTIGNEYENVRLIIDDLRVHVAFVTSEDQAVAIPDRHFEEESAVWTIKQIVNLIVETNTETIGTNQALGGNGNTVLHWLCYFNDSANAVKWVKMRDDIDLTIQDSRGMTVLDISPDVISWEIMSIKLRGYHDKMDTAVKLIEEAAEIHSGLATALRPDRNPSTVTGFIYGFLAGVMLMVMAMGCVGGP